MNVLYSKGEIVWAKMSGYAWWPGKIKLVYLKLKKRQSNNITLSQYEETPTFSIEFYPNKSYQNIPYDKVNKYIEHYDDYSHNKQKSFTKALTSANNDYTKTVKDIPSKYLYGILGKKRIRVDKSLSSKKCEKKLKTGSPTKKNIDANSNPEKDDNKCKAGNKKYISENCKINSIKGKREANSDSGFNGDLNKDKGSQDNDDIENKKVNSEKHNKKNRSYNIQEIQMMINCIANDLIRYKIEINGKEANKSIQSCLDRLSNIINKEEAVDYCKLSLDFIPLLNSLTTSLNEKIVLSSVELIGKMKEGVMKEIFEFKLNYFNKLLSQNIDEVNELENNDKNRKEMVILIKKYQNDNKINKQHSRMYSPEIVNKERNKKNKSEPKKVNLQIKNKQSSPNKTQLKKEGDNSNNNSNSSINNSENIESKIMEELNSNNNFITLLINSLSSEDNSIYDNEGNNKESKGNLYFNYFNNFIYKKENHLDEKSISIRKNSCMNLFKAIKQNYPSIEESTIKKCSLFLEYLVRKKDNEFGDKYKEFLKVIIKKINRQKNNSDKLSNNITNISNKSNEHN